MACSCHRKKILCVTYHSEKYTFRQIFSTWWYFGKYKHFDFVVNRTEKFRTFHIRCRIICQTIPFLLFISINFSVYKLPFETKQWGKLDGYTLHPLQENYSMAKINKRPDFPVSSGDSDSSPQNFEPFEKNEEENYIGYTLRLLQENYSMA